MTLTTRKNIDKLLNDLGYKIKSSFNYKNNFNHGQNYLAKSCYIVEKDTGISFAHYKDARRDNNFIKLQELRSGEEFMVGNRVYEL